MAMTQEAKNMEIPTIYKACGSRNIDTKYGLIWYSTSILGSQNSHWGCRIEDTSTMVESNYYH